MYKFAVLGDPISHSLSPEIHKKFGEQTDTSLSYEAIKTPLSQFEATVKSLVRLGYNGFNITVPLKEQAFKLVDERARDAIETQAVNVIKITETGKLIGHNTDGKGLVNDIVNFMGVNVSGKSLLLLGAGGAARGILPPLIRENLKSIVLANRTLKNAQELLSSIYNLPVNLPTIYVTTLDGNLLTREYDIVINSTSASLGQKKVDISTSCIGKNTLVIDLMYSKEITPFCRWASNFTPYCYDGMGMLLQQAAFSFEIWTGKLPDIKKNYSLWNIKR